MPDVGDLEFAVESLVNKSPRLRRPITTFFCFIFGAVVLVAGRGPLLHLWAAQAPRRAVITIPLPLVLPPSPPPPPFVASRTATTPQLAKPAPVREVTAAPAGGAAAAASRRSVDAPGAADPGGTPRVQERSPLIQGMIEAGFSRAQAEAALAAVNATQKSHIPKAIEWTLKRDAVKNQQEAAAEREAVWYDKMDLDGYALIWGSEHKKASIQECAEACRAWKPRPPAFYACNVFVFCPLDKCYAPAALPPGSMKGQCWLKHQPDPMHPQVNMKGDYSSAYVRRHPGAPPAVQWQAGVVVRKGSTEHVDTTTWSSRANW